MNNDEKGDHLCLGSNHVVLGMLNKFGIQQPTPEFVIFSDFVIKINRREKEQTRVMLITNKAIYNLLPNNYSKCKRRIAIELLVSITVSQISDEFVLHIPDEYDYRFKSGKKDKIAEIIAKLYKKLKEALEQQGIRSVVASSFNNKRLHIQYVNESDLKSLTLTKQMARLQTREDILRRKQALAAEQHDSDKEEEADFKGNGVQNKGGNLSNSYSSNSGQHNNQVEQLLENTERVKLEDFELLKVLGRGSFGKVMQVRKKSDGKIYAMKILRKKNIISRNQVEHTKAERKILQALQHPFLMTLRYAFQTKEKLYFVLDYYQGGELFFHLKNNRRFSEEVARLYVGEIALALGHLHSLGIVYRDLKPENILLDENGHVVLTDFGLSHELKEGDRTSTFCGTPEYLSPEIVTGSGHDRMVDWWSCGILLYELCVGIPPFYSGNVNEMYNKIQHGILRFPPFVSSECKSLIVALLNRDPKRRLGANNDVDDLKAHPFFADIDWNKMMRKEIESPYKPKIKSQEDTANFDATFTNEPVVDSMQPNSELGKSLINQQDQDQFQNFTFQQQTGQFMR